MQKFNNELLDECVEDGIITSAERFQIEALRDYKDKKRRSITKNLVDLIQMLLLILMINGSFVVLLNSENFSNSFVKIAISGIILIINLIGFYRSKKNDNYFYQEIFTLSIWFGVFLFIKCIDETNEYSYRWIENVFITNTLMLPIIFLSSSYLTLALIVTSFFFLGVPEVNIIWLMVPHGIQLFSIVLLYIFFICYRFRKTIKESNNSEGVVKGYHKYYSDKVACVMLEMMFYVLILKLYFVSIGHIDVIYIYITMVYMLYRRSKTYVDYQYIPHIVDIIYFIYMMVYFYVHDAVNYVPMNFILYHVIYYLVFLLFEQNNKLENIRTSYKIQHHFYVNMFLFIFVVCSFTDSYVFWIGVLTVVAWFNNYIAKRDRSILHGVVGFVLGIVTLLVITYWYSTWQTGLIVMTVSLIFLKLNYGRFKRVSK